MANGSLLGDIKSRLGFGGSGAANDVNDEPYDAYDDGYDDGYDDYDTYDDGYDNRDPYMERTTVTTRNGSYSRPLRDEAATSPRLVSMADARASARALPYNRETASSRSSTIRSYGRTMVDSSLPPSMTAEGTAAEAAAINNKRAGGLDSLFGSGSDSGTSASASSGSRLKTIGAAANSAYNASGDIIRNSMQLSMPGQRKLQVIKPRTYEDAAAVTEVLKGGDAAILVFTGVDRSLMMRILDFSFGAASALDASVECIKNGVFAICIGVGLDDAERADLRSMGIA